MARMSGINASPASYYYSHAHRNIVECVKMNEETVTGIQYMLDTASRKAMVINVSQELDVQILLLELIVAGA